MEILYKTRAKATGGRDGRSVSDDNRLDVKLNTPKELGGAGGDGTNPEQLLAAGYSACFLSALKFVALQSKAALPDDTAVTADIGIGTNGRGGFDLDIELSVELPGLPTDEARKLIDQAHEVCPYSNATRDNVAVRVGLA
jgi:osmotically inducible protein OsmC